MEKEKDEWNELVIVKLHTNSSTGHVLRCKKPPKEILKKIADLLNSYIDGSKRGFIDYKYFDIEV